MSFDAHGNRRDADTWSDAALAPGVPANTTRGFTGHEHIDAANIVHMNGRLYDPALGRMLSADPIVQELFNAQNLNRYTYVLNNPLSFTDPTGLSFFRKYWRTIVSVALTAFVPALAPAAWSNLAVAAATGFVAGVITSGTLQGGLFGAFSAVLFHGIGEYFDNLAKINISDGVFGSGLTVNQFASKVLSHAIAGGIMNRLQGGKFGDGFAGAGVTQALSPAIGRVNSSNRGFSPLRVAVAAMVGGTASAAGGGKFANGAVTAAFSRGYNDEFHNLWDKASKAVSDGIDHAKDNIERALSILSSPERVLDDASFTFGYGRGIAFELTLGLENGRPAVDFRGGTGFVNGFSLDLATEWQQTTSVEGLPRAWFGGDAGLYGRAGGLGGTLQGGGIFFFGKGENGFVREFRETSGFKVDFKVTTLLSRYVRAGAFLRAGFVSDKKLIQ
ncbi:MAG: RHS repeat-associated core domain-containing protein [Lysobacterales bacterium]